jgi:hypothetical protein
VHHAAMWHDIGRTDDGADYYHGAKSASKVVGLGLHEGIDADVVESALFLVTHHCGSEERAGRAVRGVLNRAARWEAFRVPRLIAYPSPRGVKPIGLRVRAGGVISCRMASKTAAKRSSYLASS